MLGISCEGLYVLFNEFGYVGVAHWAKVIKVNDIVRDVLNIWFWLQLAGYLAIFYCPVPVLDPAKMLNGTGYHNQIFYLLTNTNVAVYNLCVTKM